MTKEQEFQVELERFKQKFSWESKIYYIILAAFISIILKSTEDGQFLGINLLWWLLIFGLSLIVLEYLVNRYMNKQKEELINKFKH